jgi:hypothetical protein
MKWQFSTMFFLGIVLGRVQRVRRKVPELSQKTTNNSVLCMDRGWARWKAKK